MMPIQGKEGDSLGEDEKHDYAQSAAFDSSPAFKFLDLIDEIKMLIAERMSPLSRALFSLTSKIIFNSRASHPLRNETLARHAASEGDLELYEFLIENYPSDLDSSIAFELAAKGGHLRLLDSIRSLFEDDQTELERPFGNAVRKVLSKGRRDIYEILLSWDKGLFNSFRVQFSKTIGAIEGFQLDLIPPFDSKSPHISKYNRAAIKSRNLEVLIRIGVPFNKEKFIDVIHQTRSYDFALEFWNQLSDSAKTAKTKRLFLPLGDKPEKFPLSISLPYVRVLQAIESESLEQFQAHFEQLMVLGFARAKLDIYYYVLYLKRLDILRKIGEDPEFIQNIETLIPACFRAESYPIAAEFFRVGFGSGRLSVTSQELIFRNYKAMSTNVSMPTNPIPYFSALLEVCPEFKEFLSKKIGNGHFTLSDAILINKHKINCERVSYGLQTCSPGFIRFQLYHGLSVTDEQVASSLSFTFSLKSKEHMIRVLPPSLGKRNLIRIQKNQPRLIRLLHQYGFTTEIAADCNAI